MNLKTYGWIYVLVTNPDDKIIYHVRIILDIFVFPFLVREITSGWKRQIVSFRSNVIPINLKQECLIIL